MTFDIHPSEQLNSLFQSKPYQGQVPEKAKIIFLSSDANYSDEISKSVFFDRILEYHNDGVIFWKKYDVHHPFLLSDYPFDKRKDGVVFHRNFKKLELTHVNASDISFLELLDVPTIGIKSLSIEKFMRLISKSHLQYLDDLLLSNQQKLVLIPSGVMRDMMKIKKKYSLFDWLDYPRKEAKFEKVIAGTEIREIYHFSSTQFHTFLPTLRSLIKPWLSN